MIEITDQTYRSLAMALREAIADENFYSGSIDCDSPDIYSTLTATLIVYRDDEELPEGRRSVVSDIVPVWWEFSTATPSGGEELNDFSFAELKRVYFSE